MASNSASPASRPVPKPARATDSGIRWRASVRRRPQDGRRCGVAWAASARACGTAAPEQGGRARDWRSTAAKNAAANVARLLCGRFTQRREVVLGDRAQRLAQPGVDLRLAERARQRIEKRAAEVEDVLREVEVEERGLPLLVLRRRGQHVVGEAGGLGHRHVDHDEQVEGDAAPRASAGCRPASAPGCRSRRASPGSGRGGR